MTLNPQDARPVSQQIADLLRTEISDGTLRPGAKVESIRKLAARFGVSPQAAENALNILKSEGLTYTNTGRGTFVRPEAAAVLSSAEKSPEFVAVSKRLDELFEVISDINGRVQALEAGGHANRERDESRPG